MSLLDLSVASGDGSLSVRRISIQEGISRLFTISVVARTEDPSLNLEAIVGKPAALRAATGYAYATVPGRTWTGICSYAEQVQALAHAPGERPLSTYFFRIVPGLWLLTQRQGYRIYQHLSIPDIVDKLLKEWSVEPTWKIDRGKYPKLEYKAQYGESDYAFLSRLLEEAGIAFTFPDDEEKGSVLTFGDKLQLNPPRAATIPYGDNPNQAAEKEFVTNLRLSHEVRPGGHTLRDYDFRNPAFALFGEAAKAPGPEDLYEQYHYRPGSMLIEGGKPGGTPVADDQAVARWEQRYGKERAQRALEADRTGKRVIAFDTNCVDLAPGVVFGVENHPHTELTEKLLVTDQTIDHVVGQEWHMSARAVFIKEPYRPAMVTPKPQIHGVQSAMVVGPKGQEIHTDEFGRVRVQFPWDREGVNDEHSSPWIRVSQGWAGTGFGMINIPRIGQEVLIGFLDGDPDQPIIVGRVFNAIQQVPYKLPENKTVSGWKTNSSPEGGGYNEIKLEDKKNLELFYVQAQRNLDKLVKNDETERTQRHHHGTVAGNQDLVVKMTKKELVEGDDHLHVKGERMEKIDKSTSLTVVENQEEKIGKVLAVEAGKEIHLKAGQTLVIEAGTRLTVKGPGGFIDIHSGGIDIVGTLVKINSGGSAGSGSGADPKLPEEAEEAQPKDSSS
ncbi:MAG: type VI secretion system tip protein TssI/VgrG [Minicystis sp.]